MFEMFLRSVQSPASYRCGGISRRRPRARGVKPSPRRARAAARPRPPAALTDTRTAY
eukprot:COSAG02_NODE_1743_length_11100_cov_17.677575_5_plen_57_part_00